MYLNDVLKTAAIEELRQIDIFRIDYYARKNETTLNYLYNQGIIDDISIEGALEEVVLNQARKDYQLIIAKNRSYVLYADDVGIPEYLAYALGNGIFSKEEIKQIPFDHVDTAENFPQKYCRKNLLSILKEELLNPIPLPKFEEDSDPHPICSCGH